LSDMSKTRKGNRKKQTSVWGLTVQLHLHLLCKYILYSRLKTRQKPPQPRSQSNSLDRQGRLRVQQSLISESSPRVASGAPGRYFGMSSLPACLSVFILAVSGYQRTRTSSG
jgi:hypothetical protein